MNIYSIEDYAWERLKDTERELEQRRLRAHPEGAAWARMVKLVVRRSWWIAGLAMHRPPRRRGPRVS